MIDANSEKLDDVLDALKADGLSLQSLDTVFKKNFDAVKTAVNQNGMALAFADDLLRGDFDIINIAVEQNPKAIQYADLALVPKERTFVIKVMNELEQLGKEENKKLIDDCKYYLFLINEVYACDSDEEWESHFGAEVSSIKQPSR